MSMTDPIADFLTRVRNAQTAGHQTVEMSGSRMKEQLARILEEEGYIAGWSCVAAEGPGTTLGLQLKYETSGKGVIRGLKRVSKPGRRVYRGNRDIPKVCAAAVVRLYMPSLRPPCFERALCRTNGLVRDSPDDHLQSPVA